MKKGLPVLTLCLAACLQLHAQQSVSIGTTNTNPSAVLWLNAPNKDQALIIPVVDGTSAVPNPVAGMVVYDQQTNAMYYRSNSGWEKLGGAVTLTAGAGIGISGSTITNTGDTNPADDITTSTAAAGDLSGTYPSPTVSKIRGVNVSATAPTANQVLQFVGGNWTPSNAGGGTVTTVSGTAPLSVTTPTSTPVISMTQANTTTNGFLSSTDWTTFNSKIGPATAATTDLSGTFGTPTVARIRGVNVSATPPAANQVLQFVGGSWTPATPTSGTVTNVTGTAPVSVATGTSTPVVSMTQANGTTNGFLSSTDWTTFNNKIGNASQAANTVLAAPNGSAGSPTFRTLVTNDIPALDAAKITTGTFPLTRIAGAGAGVRGILGSNNNVLGWVNGSPNQVLGTDGAGNLQFINSSTFGTSALPDGQIFVGNAANTATPVSVSGDLTIANTGNMQIAPNTIADADVSATAAIAGVKINPDFGSQNVLTLGNAGVGTNTPGYKFDVWGPNPSININETGAANSNLIFSRGGNAQWYLLENFQTPTDNIAFYDASQSKKVFQIAQGGQVSVDGFTSLGAGAPAVKFAYFTGTTGAAQGATVTIPLTGVNGNQIISVDVMVEWSPNSWLSQGYYNGGYKFYFYTFNSTLYVINDTTSSGSILSKPFRCLVIYTP